MKEKFYMKEKSQKVSDSLSQIKVNLCDDVDVSPVKNNPNAFYWKWDIAFRARL